METNLNHKDVVRAQYKNADNLNTRISIHHKYSTNKMGFGNWIVSNYDIRPQSKILELGCGTGDMWKSNLDVINHDSELFLTDFSEGMLATAGALLGQRHNVTYQVVNIENIPFEDNSFDVVIANMMLYHVPDLNRGLAEVKRVIKTGGRFYCATYGENGIIPYIVSLLEEDGVIDDTNKSFTLQNGSDILSNYFEDVCIMNYEDSLAVTDIEDMIDYIYSLPNITNIASIKRELLKSILENKMVNGVLHIPKEYGMFLCVNNE